MSDVRTTPVLVASLARHFPSHFAKLDRSEAVALQADYCLRLNDIPPDLLAAVVDDYIQTEENPFGFPTVGKLRALAAERALALPGEAEALRQIADRELGIGAINPLVSEALKQVGGWYAWRTCEEPTVIRGQFARIYRELRAAAIKEAQINKFSERPAIPPRTRVS
jgi:hypothetical protein